MIRKPFVTFLPLAAVTLACNALGGFFQSGSATPVALPTVLPTHLDPNYQPGGASTVVPPPPSATVVVRPTLGLPALPEESLLILAPGPLSRIASPVEVAGISNPAFENTLSVQVLGEDGSVLGTGFASIQADIGQRGHYEGLVEFAPPGQPQPGTLIVADISARDGHLIHLASVPVTLLPAGLPVEIRSAHQHPEDIFIEAPVLAQVVSGGVVSVSGFSVSYFEQNLQVAVLDESGATVGDGALTIQAELGQPGRFEGDIAYSVASEQAGAVQVFATSPRDGSLVHLAAVEVTLRP